MHFSFTQPAVLALLPVAVAVLLLARRRALNTYASRHAYWNPLARHVETPTPRGSKATLPLALTIVTLALVAAANPVVTGYREVSLKTGYTGSIHVPAAPGVVLVVDVSGSMSGVKLETAKKAMLRFIDLLNNTVDLGLIAFNTAVVTAVPPTRNRSAVRTAVEKLSAGGGTMFTYPLTTAYNWLEVYREYKLPAIVVMATDGLPADIAEYKLVVREMAKAGIKAYTIFIGTSPVGIRETRFIAGETGGKQYTASQVGSLVHVLEKIAGETNRIVANVTVKTRVTVRKEYRVSLAPYLYLASTLLIAALSYLRYRASRLEV